jgi:hypothetical protein
VARRARRSRRAVGRDSPLTTAQARALARLSEAHVLDDVYLAGGVAVAIHLRHRQSVDLDLFSRDPDLDFDALAGVPGQAFATWR